MIKNNSAFNSGGRGRQLQHSQGYEETLYPKKKEIDKTKKVQGHPWVLCMGHFTILTSHFCYNKKKKSTNKP